MEDNFAVRLKHFIETEGLTNSQFADLCEIPRPSLSQIISGRNKKISDLLIGAIHHAFPKLSILWLMFGEGEMYGPTNSQIQGGNENDPPGVSYEDFSGATSMSTQDGTPPDNSFIPLGQGHGIGEYPLPQGEGSVDAVKMRIENPVNPASGSNTSLYSKENGLTHPSNAAQTRMNTRIEADYRILNLQRQIDEMRQNPRKVTQITIYYDDSTFETFVPGTPKN